MAIMNQLLSEAELKSLPPEEVETIMSFVRAGGTVAEFLDAKRINVAEVEGARFRRVVQPELHELLAKENLEKAKAGLR